MPASKQAYKKRAERLSFCIANRKRYEVTCDSVSGKPQEQKAQMRFLVSRNVARLRFFVKSESSFPSCFLSLEKYFFSF